MTTAAQLIESASYTARVTPQEQSIQPYVSQRGLEIFNDILAEFGGNSVDIPMQSVVNFNTVIGQAEYVNGIGQQINSNQIIQILDMYATYQSVRYPMFEFTEKNNRFIPYPTNQGVPQMFLLRKFPSTSNIIIMPVPSFVYEITMICKQRLSLVTLNTELSSLPIHWLRGLKYMIAKEMRVYFNLPEDPNLTQIASETKRNLEAANVVDVYVEKTEVLTKNRFCFPYFWGVFPNV